MADIRHVTAYRAGPTAIQHLAPVVPADWPLDRSWATQRAAEQCHSKGGARQRNRKELICE